MQQPVDDSQSWRRLSQRADVPSGSDRRCHSHAIHNRKVLDLDRRAVHLDAARTIDAGTRRTSHHDHIVISGKRNSVPPCCRVAGENGLRWEHEPCRLTANAVVNADPSNHVHTMQNPLEFRTQQPASADQSVSQSIPRPERSFAQRRRNSESGHPGSVPQSGSAPQSLSTRHCRRSAPAYAD